MIDLEQEVEMTWVGSNTKYFINKGYNYTKQHDKFKVKLKDLPVGSNKKIIYICDYCGDIIKASYNDYYKHKILSVVDKDACTKCKTKKAMEGNLITYGKLSINSNDVTIEDVCKEFLCKQYTVVIDKIQDKFIKDKTIIYYYCNKHSEQILSCKYGAFKNNHAGCKKCRNEKYSENRRTDYAIVLENFKKMNLKLLTKEYINAHQKLDCVCAKHSNIIQQISYKRLCSGYGCRYCLYEYNKGEPYSRWHGINPPLYEYLKQSLYQWKQDTLNFHNYTCLLTGKKTHIVHHLYGFDLIIEELFDFFDLEPKIRKTKISEFLIKDLEKYTSKCIELHYKSGLGICLEKSVHKLFHKHYKYGSNTPQQFEEFRQRYLAGEFDETMQK
jgi:hypothetical protein